MSRSLEIPAWFPLIPLTPEPVYEEQPQAILELPLYDWQEYPEDMEDQTAEPEQERGVVIISMI